MARTVAYPPAAMRRVADLAASGVTIDAAHLIVNREGFALSRATVGRMFAKSRGVGTGIADRNTPATPPTPPPTPPPPVAAPVTAASADIEAVRALIPSLVAAADRALADEETGAVNSLLRTISQLMTQLAKLDPPPPPDPDAHPDMVAAAAKGRAKLASYVEKARLGK